MGKAAYDRGDYALPLRLLRPLADQGNAEAQFNLRVMYGNAHGMPQDYGEAVKVSPGCRWPLAAAKQCSASGDRLDLIHRRMSGTSGRHAGPHLLRGGTT